MERTPPNPNTKQRKCLRCQKMFKSIWAGNRICGHCHKRRPVGGVLDEQKPVNERRTNDNADEE